jgi:hypothetical protein
VRSVWGIDCLHHTSIAAEGNELVPNFHRRKEVSIWEGTDKELAPLVIWQSRKV